MSSQPASQDGPTHTPDHGQDKEGGSAERPNSHYLGFLLRSGFDSASPRKGPSPPGGAGPAGAEQLKGLAVMSGERLGGPAGRRAPSPCVQQHAASPPPARRPL